MARAAALGVEPLVLGPVPRDTLPALVATAGVFAFPSTKEGFGLAAMEALAAGVPLVDASANPECHSGHRTVFASHIVVACIRTRSSFDCSTDTPAGVCG